MAAFEEAVRVGADYIEVDVRTTSDGKLVLMHDATVDRCTISEVAKMTFDEIRALDAGIKTGPEFAGTKVPTFDKPWTMPAARCIYVDVKKVVTKDLVDHIVEHGMAENVVIYSGWISKEIQQLNPKLKIMPESSNVEMVKRIVTGATSKGDRLRRLGLDSGDHQARQRLRRGTVSGPAGFGQERSHR